MRRFLIPLLALFFAAPLFAHQQKAAFSQVLMNPRSGMLEVAHRFWLHDAEHAVQQLFDSKADIIADEATQQRFASYVVERFSIREADGQPIVLSFVGAEIERNFIWIYQEAKPPRTQRLTISHNALLDIWSGQENMLNVEGLGELKTVFFQAHQKEATINLE